MSLKLERKTRQELIALVSEKLENYFASVSQLPVNPQPTLQEVKKRLSQYTFENPLVPSIVLEDIDNSLREFQLHTSHPAYFGVFNPNPAFMGILAELLTAAYNPQLASSTSSLYCIEIENQLIRFFADKFTLPKTSEGTFTSGGNEANFTAIACALQNTISGYSNQGIGNAKPVIYTSSETHHSIKKSAKVSGLGLNSVRVLPVDEKLKFRVDTLESAIAQDLKNGFLPLMIIATAGSTSAGVFDPINELAAIAQKHNLWLHLDAAWGGSAVLLPEFESLFKGCEFADSITLDAHKWLSIPMGCSLFLTRHKGLLKRTFQADDSPYMPSHAEHETTQPYLESFQWSRRALGLKLFMTLAVAGLSGMQNTLRHQIAIGNELRKLLTENSWLVVNDSPLPVVCFVSQSHPVVNRKEGLKQIAKLVGDSGKSWLTTTELSFSDNTVLRAGISNFATQNEHLDILIQALNQARGTVS